MKVIINFSSYETELLNLQLILDRENLSNELHNLLKYHIFKITDLQFFDLDYIWEEGDPILKNVADLFLLLNKSIQNDSFIDFNDFNFEIDFNVTKILLDSYPFSEFSITQDCITKAIEEFKNDFKYFIDLKDEQNYSFRLVMCSGFRTEVWPNGNVTLPNNDTIFKEIYPCKKLTEIYTGNVGISKIYSWGYVQPGYDTKFIINYIINL